MNTLSEILSSRTRSEIFKLLFGTVEEELHVREIQRRSGLNDSTIRQELRKLVRLDLVIGRKDSNRVYYKANKSNPLYTDLRNLVLKTVGLADILRDALQDERIQVVFVFGSMVEGKENSDSDVDLLIIGDVGLRKIAELLEDVSEKIGREINPNVISKDEFLNKIKTGEHFISSIMNTSKLFIIGTERDLEEMGR